MFLMFTETRPPKMKLECLAQYTLHSNIMSMQAVHLVGSQRDSLLLSFLDAKLSVVEYDQDIHDLRPVSLHYFEEEEIKVQITTLLWSWLTSRYTLCVLIITNNE